MTKTVSVKLEEEEVKVLKEFAKKHGYLFSSFVRVILQDTIKNIMKEQQ